MHQAQEEAQDPPPNRRPRKWMAWGLSLLGLAAIVLAGQQIYARTADSADNADAQVTSGSMLATIAELQAFIEDARDLKFKDEVKVTLLSEKNFKARLLRDSKQDQEENSEESSDSEALFKAFKLIPSTANLDKVGAQAATEGVLGFYDTRSNDLVIRGEQSSPFIKTVLVHELTHALQDQHFDIDRPELYDTDDDSSLGLESVVEGDASRIEGKYFRSVGAEEQRLIQTEQEKSVESSSDGGIPEALLALISFPYEVGTVFTEELERAGGNARIDEVLKNPPMTAEQLLHPQRYLRGEGAISVAKPAGDGDVFDDGVVGELGLILLLTEAMPRRVALEAADGWGGDRYVAWRTGVGACARFGLVMDTPVDLKEAKSALNTWARMHGSATVKSLDEAIEVTACAKFRN